MKFDPTLKAFVFARHIIHAIASKGIHLASFQEIDLALFALLGEEQICQLVIKEIKDLLLLQQCDFQHRKELIKYETQFEHGYMIV